MRGSIILTLACLTVATSAHAQTDANVSTCIIKPHVQIQLGSAVSGMLSVTLADRGDTVKQGQVVAQLESTVEQATLALDRMRASNDSAIKVEQVDKELNMREADRKQ